jgi:hypothetical protein
MSPTATHACDCIIFSCIFCGAESLRPRPSINENVISASTADVNYPKNINIIERSEVIKIILVLYLTCL